MGVDCPQCGTHQAIVRNITADGESPKKASDVMARKLACGHVIGGEKYNEYVKKVNEINTASAAQKQAIDDEASSKKAGLWKAIAEPGKVV